MYIILVLKKMPDNITETFKPHKSTETEIVFAKTTKTETFKKLYLN